MNINVFNKNLVAVWMEDLTVLYSYGTPVALIADGLIYVTSTKWSNTTSRHINKWIKGLWADPEIHEISQADLERIVYNA
jgi:hypothetical protein